MYKRQAEVQEDGKFFAEDEDGDEAEEEEGGVNAGAVGGFFVAVGGDVFDGGGFVDEVVAVTDSLNPEENGVEGDAGESDKDLSLIHI